MVAKQLNNVENTQTLYHKIGYDHLPNKWNRLILYEMVLLYNNKSY
jgi:hypothetical protein